MKSLILKHKFIVLAGITTSAIVGVFIFILFISINKPQFSNNDLSSNTAQTENAKVNPDDANQESGHFNIFSILNKFISN